MATKLEKAARVLNDEFRTKLKLAMKELFDCEIETKFNFFSAALVTKRVDGKNFKKKEKDFLAAYERGYLDCMQLVERMK